MGQDQLNKVGSFGREDEAKLYREQVLTLLDAGHFLHDKLPIVRYDIEDPEMQGLIESIRGLGILQPGEAWHFEDTGTTHVIFGERRTIALNIVNQERIAADQDPIPMRYKVRIFKALTAAIEQDALDRKADENNRNKGNDWLTVCFAVKRQLALGVDPGLVLARWPMIESETLMERMAKDSGITAAIPALQEALARGQIKLRKALSIADLPLDKQADALAGKQERQKSAEPKAVRMPVLKRLLDEVRSNREFNDMSAQSLLSILCGADDATQNQEQSNALKLILAEASKPGQKKAAP